MLAKLFKHEMKALGRQLLPMYGIVILITCINKLGMLIDVDILYFNTLRSFLAIAYVMVIVALFIACWIIIIVRFFKNLLSNEGYLSFTLPVSANAHIFIKLICAVIMAIISIAVAVASLLILGFGTKILNDIFIDFSSFSHQMYSILGGHYVMYIVEIAIMLIVLIAQSFLMLYAAMSLGQLFGRNRVLGAFVSYFIIYFVLQIIMSIVLTLFYFVAPDMISINLTFQQGIAVAHISFLGITAFYCVLSLVYYLITRYMLTRRLNLE